MEKLFFTLTGTRHYFGSDFLEPKMKLELVKEPDNVHDKEAIYVRLEGLGKIGYVANSPNTVIGESKSAGRLYDKIGDTAVARVMYITNQGILCKICEEEYCEYDMPEDNDDLARAIRKILMELNIR